MSAIMFENHCIFCLIKLRKNHLHLSDVIGALFNLKPLFFLEKREKDIVEKKEGHELSTRQIIVAWRNFLLQHVRTWDEKQKQKLL